MSIKNKNQSIPGILARIIMILLVLAGILSACSSPSGETLPEEDPPGETAPDQGLYSKEVVNLMATCFQFKNEIRISWEPPANAPVDTYSVYRSLYDDSLFEKIGEVKSTYFNDVNSNFNVLRDRIPYYYLVTWKAVGENNEYGGKIKPSLGIYSAEGIDFCEPNDLYNDISSKGSFFTVHQPMQHAFLYSVKRKNSETEVDTDWYKYICIDVDSQSTVFITIRQPEDSPFLDSQGDRLYFRFYFQNQAYPEYMIEQPVTYFDFDEFIENQESQELYFTIYPAVVTNRPCMIISYTVYISNELL